MEIINLYKDTFAFDEGGVRFFLLNGQAKSLLIDSGMKTHNALDIVKEYTLNPIELINTHADIDHIGSNQQFRKPYMHPSECVNYKGSISCVWDGDYIDLGNRLIQIIHIPGHTPGSIALLDVNNRSLFSGDPVQKNGSVFMFGPMRNLEANIHSLNRLDSLDSFDVIYPSHGDISLDKSIIKDMREGCLSIMDGHIGYSTRSMFGREVKEYNLGFCYILMD